MRLLKKNFVWIAIMTMAATTALSDSAMAISGNDTPAEDRVISGLASVWSDLFTTRRAERQFIRESRQTSQRLVKKASEPNRSPAVDSKGARGGNSARGAKK